ncbi:hypothetical protein VTO42DRAFT_7290 [Malbranchea cinnamomea]
MDGFDTMTMSYLADPLSMGTMQNGDYLNTMPSLDTMPPHHLEPYDGKTFVSGDDISFTQPPMPPPPMRRFSNAQFEEPFPEMMPPFEAPPPDQQAQQDSSIDHNHKLLSFSVPMYHFPLLDYSLRRTSLSMTAQLHGMFFLAESQWTASPPPDPNVPRPQPELTCYRRNLFQITGSVTLPRSLRYIMTDNGDRIPILATELTVSATESVEGNPVKIISVPWKTPAANATGQPEDKTEKEPPAIPLDTMAGPDVDSDYATFSIAWKRLQFRIATANNGRRKELQQHFIVRLKVVATLSTGAKIAICEAQSGPVIVRGRSPRNFQSRKDLPLSGSALASHRKNHQAALNRASNNDSARSHQVAGSKRSKSPQDPVHPPLPLHLDSPPQQPQPPHSASTVAPDWTTATTLPAYTTTAMTAPVSAYAQSSSEISRPAEKRRRTSANSGAISLSLIDTEPNPSPSSNAPVNSASPVTQATNGQQPDTDGQPPAKGTRTSPTPSTRQSLANNYNITAGMNLVTQLSQDFSPQLVSPHILSTNETADLLYEYFPLGLDDWQPPVDAVYRPHVVHHMNLPDDPKAIAVRSRGKTYFAGEAS